MTYHISDFIPGQQHKVYLSVPRKVPLDNPQRTPGAGVDVMFADDPACEDFLKDHAPGGHFHNRWALVAAQLIVVPRHDD